MLGIDTLIGYGIYGDTKDWKKTAIAGGFWGIILAVITFILSLLGVNYSFLLGTFNTQVLSWIGSITIIIIPLATLISSILGALLGGLAYRIKEWLVAQL
ncbi:MAG: hypothetical protein J7K62_03235 [Thermoplasmata archaeon]|nr:hypothetical protein [Thermoplasmata archaeon]